MSTRVSKRVTRQEGLTRVGSVFHVNAYRRLTEEGLPVAVIQPGLETNPGSCEEALRNVKMEESRGRTRSQLTGHGEKM